MGRPMQLRGRIKVDRKTKNLVKRLKTNEIAVIAHEDLDEVAALSLIKAKPRLVINVSNSMTGKYPNLGPLRLLEAGIPLIDQVDPDFLELAADDQEIECKDEIIKIKNKTFSGVLLQKEEVIKKLKEIRENYSDEVVKFVQNTLEYAAKEIDLISKKIYVPGLRTNFTKKHVLIVVRGHNYQEDLKTIRPYILEIKPILIGVDGGADALLENGYRPHIIIGDMDSVSNEALKCGAELIVHAYPNGEAPGLKRIKQLNLSAHVLPAKGTSEDVAMLLAYDQGADLIVAVGSHSNVIDFLDKGRKGMASTFLVRLKVGSILVDAKGVSKLYRRKLKIKDMIKIVAAALLPLLVVIMVSPITYPLIRLVFIRFRLLLFNF